MTTFFKVYKNLVQQTPPLALLDFLLREIRHARPISPPVIGGDSGEHNEAGSVSESFPNSNTIHCAMLLK